jgi:hypothetical protein
VLESTEQATVSSNALPPTSVEFNDDPAAPGAFYVPLTLSSEVVAEAPATASAPAGRASCYGTKKLTTTTIRGPY